MEYELTKTWQVHSTEDITTFNYLLVAQLFGEIDIEYVGQNVDQQSSRVEPSADGVDGVVVLCVRPLCCFLLFRSVVVGRAVFRVQQAYPRPRDADTGVSIVIITDPPASGPGQACP